MKAKEITPQELRCAIGACPSIFETDRGTIVIVGKVLDTNKTPRNIRKKLGVGEVAIEIPKNVLIRE